MEWIAMLLTFVTGGGLMAMFTIKPTRKKAEAEAETIEIENADRVAKMWREYAEASERRYQETIAAMSAEMTKMQASITSMECVIKRLTTTNNQILKILKEINHENLEQKKQEAEDAARA
jgi:hypothetical protein